MSLSALCAIVMLGLVPTQALAGSTKGSIEAQIVKRDVQPIPDQEGHVLMLGEDQGTSANAGGPLDGFSVSLRQTLDLRQDSGPQRGYMIYSKGPDMMVVSIDGAITTTMKDGQPNVSFKGDWAVVGAKGALDGSSGAGTYSGYFTAQDKYHVDWTGNIDAGKEAKAN
jgi:hypothetical protein